MLANVEQFHKCSVLIPTIRDGTPVLWVCHPSAPDYLDPPRDREQLQLELQQVVSAIIVLPRQPPFAHFRNKRKL